MKNTIEKVSDVCQKLFNNFWIEIEKDPEVKLGVDRYLFQNPFLKKMYSSAQFGDYIVSKYTKEYINPLFSKKGSSLDRIIEKNFKIPQYYGGIRDFNHKTKNGNEMSIFKEYNMIDQVENREIPEIMKNLFEFKDIDNIIPEVDETFKQLKKYLFDLEKEWIGKEILLDDIRSIETESINVKNFKKTVRSVFEMSLILSGKCNDGLIGLKKVFNCSIEFVRDNGKWIVSSFSFSPL